MYCSYIILRIISIVQHIGRIVIIFVQGAAISQIFSVQCAVLFKVIPLSFLLLISALLLTEILLDFSRSLR